MPLVAQQRLAHARQRSYYTKVFRLTEPQTQLLYNQGLSRARQEFFTAAVDSFPTDSLTAGMTRPLPLGYYLVAHTQGAQLVYWLRTVSRLQVAVLNNQADLVLTVRDSSGQLLRDAQVRLHRRRVPLDPLTGTYRLAKGGREGLLAITQDGRTTYHLLERKRPYGWEKRGWVKRALFSFPLSLLSSPVRTLWHDLHNASYTNERIVGLLRSIFNEEVRYERQEQRERKREEYWVSYLALSKPHYRPSGDTLRLKARVLRRRDGKPSTDPLDLMLQSQGKVKKVATLRPVRPGSYLYTLPLTDTLGLQADRNVTLYLQDRQEITRAEETFYFHDYELKNTHYTLRAAQTIHRAGTAQAFYLRGTDANELPLLDARVRLVVLPLEVRELGRPTVFVPDTLWTTSQALDPVGETRINLPAGVLPATALRYRVEATFLNADQEQHVAKETITYHLDPAELTLTLQGDSLQLRYLVHGQSVPQAATLERWAENGPLGPVAGQKVQLPLSLPVQPHVARYVLRDAQGHRAELRLSEANAGLSVQSDRTRDSLYVAVENPHRIPFWYFLYRGNQLMQRGTGTSWQVALRTPARESWFVSLHYLWGGEIQAAEYRIQLPQKALLIQAEQPAVAYPGQHLRLHYTVTDASGEPAAGVDLTSYAYTTKFAAPTAPALPDFEPYRPGRIAGRRFSLGTAFDSSPQKPAAQILGDTWPQWRERLGLGSLRFYQFLYPDQGRFLEYRPAPGGITQLAPFVVDSGRIAPVAAVYVDGVPVYIREINAQEPYAIVADSGYHTIALRTATRLITLEQVYLRQGHKLTLSIDPAYVQPKVQLEKRPAQFTQAEQATLNRYLLPVETDRRGGVSGSTLRQGNRLQVIAAGKTVYKRNKPVVLGGPFRPDSVLYREPTGLRQKFLLEPAYQYHFAPGLLKMTSMEPHAFQSLPAFLASSDSLPLRGFAYTEAAVRQLFPTPVFRPFIRLRLDDTVQTRAGQGTLELWRRNDLPQPLYTLVTQPGRPGFVRLLRHAPAIEGLPPGTYQVTVLLTDSTCLQPAPVLVRAQGTTYLQLRPQDQRQPGPASRRVLAEVQQRAQQEVARVHDLATREIKVKAPTARGVAAGNWPLVRVGCWTSKRKRACPGSRCWSRELRSARPRMRMAALSWRLPVTASYPFLLLAISPNKSLWAMGVVSKSE
ncbi:hypothetical protein PK28_17175 (plasmid) [Hymenobacter sp. DG25B]|nr:hypothetical protein PK28_17175 [Hymenobacter sp. DG25B]